MKLILFAFLLFKIILKISLIPYVACIISMKQCRSKKSTCGCKDKPAVHKGETGLFLQAIITPPSGEIRQSRDRFLLNCEENE